MGSGYSKLDCGIVDSSLWEQPHDVLRVWIAMLAKTDATGYVRVAPSAMARLCMVDRDRFNEIVEIFTNPDPDSRSPENEGRRLECVDGGWMILNYLKYREGLKQPDRTAAERKRRQREREECHASTVTDRDAPCRAVTDRDSHAYAEAEAEAKADAKAKAISGDKSPAPDDGFEEFWKAYPPRRGSKDGKDKARKVWKKMKPSKATQEAIMGALAVQRHCEQWQEQNGRFIPQACTWLNQARWEDEVNVQHNNGIDTQSRSHATPELIAMQARIEAEHRAEEEARRKAMA